MKLCELGPLSAARSDPGRAALALERAMAEAIGLDRNALAAKGAAGAAFARANFGVEAVVQQTLSLYDELLNGKRQSTSRSA